MSSTDEEPEGSALKAVRRGHNSDHHWGTKMSIIFKRVRNMCKTNLLLFQPHYLQYAPPVHGDKIGYELAIAGPITFIVCLGTPTLLGNINTLPAGDYQRLVCPLSNRCNDATTTTTTTIVNTTAITNTPLALHYHYQERSARRNNNALRVKRESWLGALTGSLGWGPWLGVLARGLDWESWLGALTGSLGWGPWLGTAGSLGWGP